MFRSSLLLLAAVVLVPSASAAPVISSGAGVTAATAARDAFRTTLGGGTTAGANGSFGGLRREINWDGTPDAFSAPNNLPANFFNANSPRGVLFSTPGTGFQVSANTGVAAVRFGNIDPTYPQEFSVAFSPQRLFTALGSTIVDVTFFVPGTATPATVTGFGSIFIDVDTAGTSTIEYFGLNNVSLGKFVVPTAPDVSFLGVSFNAGELIRRVRITNGTVALGQTGGDLVVMDDFLYAEPVATALPQVTEFYNVNLNHFFVTSNAAEQAAIDSGSAGPGWSRTGITFSSGGSTSVCRFYGSVTPGPNSHFYTADANECAGLKQLQATTPASQKRWNFESNDFNTTAAVNGACAAGLTPIFRAYNNGYGRGIDSNHRLTPSQAGIAEVVARGWVSEGVGDVRTLSRQRVPPDARVALDRADLRILAALQRNGRISKVELARLVNLSASACLERMRRLEKQKLIVSYHAQINLAAVMPIQMFLTEVTLGGHRAIDFSTFEQCMEQLPQIVECHALGGGIDYLLKVVASDVAAYQLLIDDLLGREIGIERYFTYVVTKVVKSLPQYFLEP